jgi:multisite-specific tRNA:(cytosine-C5)-methyltransferase
MKDGMVIANDAAQSRCDTLVHQVKRLNLNCVVITCHQAQNFPLVKVFFPFLFHFYDRFFFSFFFLLDVLYFETKTSDSKSGASYFQFDKILCDVPCSGDGTFRKNIGLWRNWSPIHALGLHKFYFLLFFFHFEIKVNYFPLFLFWKDCKLR